MKKIILVLLLSCLPVMGKECYLFDNEIICGIRLPCPPGCSNTPYTFIFSVSGQTRIVEVPYDAPIIYKCECCDKKKVEKKRIKPKPKLKKSRFKSYDNNGLCPTGCIDFYAEELLVNVHGELSSSGVSKLLGCFCVEK